MGPQAFAMLQTTAAAGPTVPPSGYGASLLQSLLALTAVCLLAWIVLRWVSQRGGLGGGGLGWNGAGLGDRKRRRLAVLERLPLDGRRALWLVRVDDRTLVVGTGDQGAPTLLREVAGDGVEAGAGEPAEDAASVRVPGSAPSTGD